MSCCVQSTYTIEKCSVITSGHNERAPLGFIFACAPHSANRLIEGTGDIPKYRGEDAAEFLALPLLVL